MVAIIGPLIAPFNPTLPNLAMTLVGPTGSHLLGFDFEGRDVLSRLLAGAQSSMLGPLAVVIGALLIGTALAIVAAWRRGLVDSVISSSLDVLFAFPGILLAVLAAAVFGAGLTAASIALAIAYMPYVARVLRGAALKERSQPYVAALEVQGASATSICVRHIIPNIAPLIVAQATIMFGYAMVDLAAISFLGLGVQPPAAELGRDDLGEPGRHPRGLPPARTRGGGVHRDRGDRVQPARRAALRAGAGGPVSEPVGFPGGERGNTVSEPVSLAAAAPLLEVDDLTVRLPVEGEQRAVLREVCLTVSPGEALGLVGESGSGKSMTARAVDRLLPRGAQVSGQIRFAGGDVGALAGAGLREYRNKVAMIFQDPRAHVNPVRRIGDFMTEALRTNLGVPAAEAHRRAADMLVQVGIADGERRLRQYPHELSGGMLQRVMIAAALLTEPQLLLADEPTTALDVTTQAEVMAILDDLRREFGLAMIFITHDLELAAAICDRTAVMYAGQIVEIRESVLMHGDPLHPYSAALAAARPDIASTAHRLAAIPGRPLSAFEAPAQECAFAPRCPHAADPCRAAVPELVSLDGGLSRCVRAAELRGALRAGLAERGESGA